MAKSPTPKPDADFRLVIHTAAYQSGIHHPSAKAVQDDLDHTRAMGIIIETFSVFKNGVDVSGEFH